MLPYNAKQWESIEGHVVDESTDTYILLANDGDGILYLDKINISTGIPCHSILVII